MVAVLLLILAVSNLCQCIRPHYPNENYIEGLFHGDIFLRNKTLTYDRFATRSKASRWPNGIVPYILDDIYSEEDKNLIRSAMAAFEKETCIKWVERTDESNYVEIYSDMGCWSELGRVGGVQSLALETPTCMKKGVIMHEMMHALGFLHEQSRPDRDDFVQILWDNIVPGMEPNFEKLNPMQLDDLGLSYDYRSIMHYRAYMFAMDRSQPTIVPVDLNTDIEELGAGQNKAQFSNLDLKKMNKFYECWE